MESGDQFVAKVKEFKSYDKNVDGLLVEVCSYLLEGLSMRTGTPKTT